MLEMKYFVLRPGKDDWHGEASRQAMLTYAHAVKEKQPELAAELVAWVARETPVKE